MPPTWPPDIILSLNAGVLAIYINLSPHMKVELALDPLFDSSLSPSKSNKQKGRDKQRLLKSQRSLTGEKKEPNIEVVDPLPEELRKYRHQIEYKKTFESSKASHKLKKYIIEQERNLKCMRLERIEMDSGLDTSRARRGELKIDIVAGSQSKQKEEKLSREIHIPRIQQLFKNQHKEIVLYESRMMRSQLAKAINLIDNGVSKIKAYSTSGSIPIVHESRRTNTITDRFPQASNGMATSTSYLNEEDYEIDAIIEKKLLMSRKLRDKLYKQKREILNNQAKESSDSKSLNFFISIPKKPKKKVVLEGVKSITFCQGDKTYNVTPASSLLFSLNKMCHGKEKKEEELEGLIQNSFQNREAILSEKSNFYDQETPFNNLNPANQFRLRQLMDKKLLHRLELSKDQINKFVALLYEVKDYHVILNSTILQVLKEVRETLLSGKVMKSSDLSIIVESKSGEQLRRHPNEQILQKLSDMMI